jgi:hypothetical protein
MLLGRGGELVVPHRDPDADLEQLIADPVDFPTPARQVAGEDGACHRNVATLWANGDTTAMGTGYALSPDQLWRQHSWALAEDGAVLETTTSPRLAYVGIRLHSGEPALRFVLGNAGDVVENLIRNRTDRGQQIVSMIHAERARHPKPPP